MTETSTPQAPERRPFLTRYRVPAVVAGATVVAVLIAGGGVAYGISIGSATTQPSISASQQDTFPPAVYTPEQSTLDARASTADEQVGVVTILTTLYYEEDSQAAGTGMILTSDGEILTNYHVIEGATSIEVTVESTGESYTATVVGSDESADVAVLQLSGASGLDTVTLDDDGVAVGDAVASVGNAEGTGDLVTAEGTVTALDQSITVSSEISGEERQLSNLIEIDADVVSGDSGGPLVDDEGEVVGIVTAASSGTRTVVGYALDIDTALAIVDQIEAGQESATVTLGTGAFMGITLAEDATGESTTTIRSVLDGLPAAAAGLAAGDTITAIDGTAVATFSELTAAVAAHDPGDRVTIDYLGVDGTTHTVEVTLVAGPA